MAVECASNLSTVAQNYHRKSHLDHTVLAASDLIDHRLFFKRHVLHRMDKRTRHAGGRIEKCIIHLRGDGDAAVAGHQ